MHEVDISPLPVQEVDLNLPLVLGTTGAEAVSIVSSAMAYVPTVTAIRNASVTAITATGSGIVYRPLNISGSIGAGVTIVVPYIPSTGTARVPAINADQTVNAVVATSTGQAVVPIPVGVGAAIVVAPVATSTENAKVPVISGGVSVSVTAAMATSTAIASVAAVSGNVIDVTVNAVVARTNAAIPEKAIAPTVSGEIVITGGGPGTATARAWAPVASVLSTPAFASVGGSTNVVGSQIQLAVPAGVTGVSTECIVATIAVLGSQTVTPPSGFIEDVASPIIVSGAEFHYLHVYWKRPTAADTGTYNFDAPGITGVYARAGLFTNCLGTGTPIDGAGFVDADASNNTTPGAFTSSGPNRLALWIVTNIAGGGVTFTGGFTERFDNLNLAFATLPVVTAGNVPASGTLQATTGANTQSAVWFGTIMSPSGP